MGDRFRILILAPILTAYILFPFQSLCAEEPTISLREALLKTLEAQPGVKIEEEKVIQSEGQLQAASGQFDWVALGTISTEQERQHLTNEQEAQAKLVAASSGTDFSDTTREETNIYSIGLRKQLRSGPVISPSLSTLDIENISSGIQSQNRADVNVDILIPLMRGFGKEITGAEEMAAESNLNATELLSKHNISESIFLTTSAYWNSLAALQRLKILEDTEIRAKEIYDLVELLVKGGELEPVIIKQAKAQLYQRQANVRQSRRDYYESKQALAVAIGFTPKKLPNAPQPQGPFPQVINPQMLDKKSIEGYIDEALDSRGDYLAAKINVDTENILTQKAKNDIKPRLNLNLRVGYSGLSEEDNATRYYRSPLSNYAGPNAFAGLSLELPIRNNAARGEFRRRMSLLKEADLTTSQLSNSIASDVLVAMERLRISAQEYQLAKQSAEAYQVSVENEKRKIRIGESSLTDLIDIEDRYAGARITLVEALRKYASALTELRFVTGTILTEEKRNFRLNLGRLLTLPRFQEPKEHQN